MVIGNNDPIRLDYEPAAKTLISFYDHNRRSGTRNDLSPLRRPIFACGLRTCKRAVPGGLLR